MTYATGSLILASDYNTIVTAINNIWGVGGGLSGSQGWGQSSTIANVSNAAQITATQWSTLNSRITSIANHTGTAITSRTGPVFDELITIQANLITDINNCGSNRCNAVASGTTVSTWTGSAYQASNYPAVPANYAWAITFVDILSIGQPSSGNSERYFWNAGGLVKINMSKLSTGLDSDQDWNDFIATLGTFYVSSGYPGQVVAGTTYNGFLRVGGSGSPTTYTTTGGWYNLTAGYPTEVFRIYNSASPYTGDFVAISLRRVASTSTTTGQLIVKVDWYSGARQLPGETTNISTGTPTTSPFSTFGTAPAVVSSVIPPSTTYITDTWQLSNPVGSFNMMVTLTYVVSANTANLVIDLTAQAGYVAGFTYLYVQIDPGVYVYSTSTSNAALTFVGGTGADYVYLNNLGYIMGMGGLGGGGTGVANGSAGGTALSLSCYTIINNTDASAYIGGGGGGGGANTGGVVGTGGGGAGGGAGANSTSGASGGAGGTPGSTGGNGTAILVSGNQWLGTGGGGGRIFPGVGGAGGPATAGATQGSGGGSGGGAGGWFSTVTSLGNAGGSGGSANAGGIVAGNAGGGGGWGASGGAGGSGQGGAGGKAVALNGKVLATTSGSTTKIYGSIA